MDDALRRFVRDRSGGVCEYGQFPERTAFNPFKEETRRPTFLGNLRGLGIIASGVEYFTQLAHIAQKSRASDFVLSDFVLMCGWILREPGQTPPPKN